MAYTSAQIQFLQTHLGVIIPPDFPEQSADGASSASKPESWVRKRSFVVARWRKIPSELKDEAAAFAKVVASVLPHEDAAGFAAALDRTLTGLTEAMQQRINDALDASINAGDPSYRAVVTAVGVLRQEVASNALIAALRTNAIASAKGVEHAYAAAFDEIETALAA